MVCKETICTGCAHREICSLKEEFLNAQEAVDNAIVSRKSGTSDKICMIDLRNITFIEPVKLVCKHYIPELNSTIRGG